jgi:membrane associated rhomboid family serine protease
MNYEDSPFALTPWVRRLLVAMGGVYLLQLTVFTSPWLAETFGFVPALVLRRPWTLLTYAFLHVSFLHILFNAIGLFMFGPPVERRLGGRSFVRLYLLAALGGALLSLVLLALGRDGLILGASGAIFGVMMAFVLEWPDAPIFVFPLPVPVKAKWLVAFFAGVSLVLGVVGSSDGVAHFAHLGGFGTAFLYLRGGTWLARARAPRPAERAPAVLVRPQGADGAGRVDAVGPTRRRAPDAAAREEIDRVLDKISQRGMNSLTPEELRFLDEISQRFKQEH